MFKKCKVSTFHSSRKNTAVSIGMIYACSVVGVGFASGNELLHFFTSYGMSGFYGILIASFLYSFLGYLIVRIAFKTGTFQLAYCYEAVGGPLFASFARWSGSAFCFCLFVLMLSAWTMVLDEVTSIPHWYRYMAYVILFLIYCLLDIQNKPLAGWMRFMILAGTGVVLFTVMLGRLSHVFSAYGITGCRSWLLSAALYIGYNSFVSADLLCKACKTAISEKSAYMGGILGGAILFILSFLFNLVFSIWYSGDHSFPLLDMAGNESYPIKIFFLCVLLLTILYSGFNSGVIVIERFTSKIPMRPVLAAIILSLLSIIALPVGFERLIAGIYPAFGFLGSFIILYLIIAWAVKVNR